MDSKDDLGDWSSLSLAAKARALHAIVHRMLRILDVQFSGLLVIESETHNILYSVLRRLAESLAPDFPAVQDILTDFTDIFPNLYESIGDPDSPDENWEYSGRLINTLKARLSDAIVETLTDSGRSLPSDLSQLLKKADRQIEEMVASKKQAETAWLNRVEKSAEVFGPGFAPKPPAESSSVNLSEEEERAFQRQGFKSRLSVRVPGRMAARKQNVVYIGGSEILLPDSEFRLLLRLVVALFETDDAYITREELRFGQGIDGEIALAPDGIDQAIGRLRRSLALAVKGLEATKFIEVVRARFRLSTHRRYVSTDLDELVKHADELIRTMALRLGRAGQAQQSPPPV